MTPTGTDERARGLAFALAAYLTWGMLPLYFKALRPIPALEILAHRVLWSLLLLAGLLAARGGVAAFRSPFRRDKLPLLALTTALISVNWLVYIWAVQVGRVLEASLGYFVNPLVNVLLGVAFLGEPLSRRQRFAVALAALGVAVLVVRAGTFPWVSLVLATSFGLYGLLRKRAAIDAVGGLFGETALLAPAALAYLLFRAHAGTGAFGTGAGTSALLAAAGAITALPLVWFTLGVHRLRLSTMGLVQYVAPSGQFLLAVLLYREPSAGPTPPPSPSSGRRSRSIPGTPSRALAAPERNGVVPRHAGARAPCHTRPYRHASGSRMGRSRSRAKGRIDSGGPQRGARRTP